MSKPQQPELRRSGKGQVEQANWSRKEAAEKAHREKGRRGPVPEENRPGDGPDADED